MKTYFSVVIATKNRCALLRKSLHCLAAQKYPLDRFEVIVVDNGSTDQTCNVVDEEMRGNSRIHYYFLQECNVSAARNLGASHAKGQWLAFTDDDCLPPPDWLPNAEKVRKRIGQAKVIGGPTFDLLPKGMHKPVGFTLSGWEKSFGKAGRYLRSNEYFIECNLFIQKKEFDRCGGFNPQLGPGNLRFGFHEGTELQARISSRHPGKTARYYDPAIRMSHLVRPGRASVVSRLRRAIIGGFDYSRAFPPKKVLPRSLLFARALGLSACLPFAASLNLLPLTETVRRTERLYFRFGEMLGELFPRVSFFKNHNPEECAHEPLFRFCFHKIIYLVKKLAANLGKSNVVGVVSLSSPPRMLFKQRIDVLGRTLPPPSCYKSRDHIGSSVHPLLTHASVHRSPPWLRGRIRFSSVFGPTPAVVGAGGAVVAELSRDWGKFGNQLGVLRSLALPPLRKLSGKTLLTAQLGGESYFHWMTDVLPILIEEKGRFGDLQHFDHFLTHHPLRAFHCQAFDRLGIPTEKIVELTKTNGYQCQELTFHTPHHVTGRAPAATLRSVARLFLPTKKVPFRAARRLAILRAEDSTRSLVCRKEIAALLISLGFEEYEPSRHTVEEQARVFAGAEVIVATHGAALTNLIFCRPKTWVLELFSARYVNPCYAHMSWQLGLRHFSLVDKAVHEGVVHTIKDSSWPIEVRPEEIRSALSCLKNQESVAREKLRVSARTSSRRRLMQLRE